MRPEEMSAFQVLARLAAVQLGHEPIGAEELAYDLCAVSQLAAEYADGPQPTYEFRCARCRRRFHVDRMEVNEDFIYMTQEVDEVPVPNPTNAIICGCGWTRFDEPCVGG